MSDALGQTVTDSRALEIANEFHERREALTRLERFAEIEDQCIDCHRVEDPGEAFEQEGTEGLICVGCKEKRIEAENLEPSSLMDTLIRWFERRQGAGSVIVLTQDELRAAIREAAWQESYTGQFPWESGDEYDRRRFAEGRGAVRPEAHAGRDHVLR